MPKDATKLAKPGMEPESGWGTILGPTTLERPEVVRTGPGNDLPVATRYRISTPNGMIPALTKDGGYTGMTMGLPFQNGQASTTDRELAWVLREDFGYTVEPEG